ncbi:insulin-like growth factor binding protein [Powellomyces hirtus]|nr:insulin-like growth factor binding protein [Powellomyces hirtus]
MGPTVPNCVSKYHRWLISPLSLVACGRGCSTCRAGDGACQTCTLPSLMVNATNPLECVRRNDTEATNNHQTCVSLLAGGTAKNVWWTGTYGPTNNIRTTDCRKVNLFCKEARDGLKCELCDLDRAPTVGGITACATVPDPYGACIHPAVGGSGSLLGWPGGNVSVWNAERNWCDSKLSNNSALYSCFLCSGFLVDVDCFSILHCPACPVNCANCQNLHPNIRPGSVGVYDPVTWEYNNQRSNLQCLVCLPGFNLVNNQCVYAGCSGATYDDGSRNCIPCHSTCSSCNGPYASNCTACANGATLTNGLCTPPFSCPSGQYPDVTNTKCLGCHPDCNQCTGSAFNQCASCASPLALSGTQCVTVCPAGQYIDASRTCQRKFHKPGAITQNEV